MTGPMCGREWSFQEDIYLFQDFADNLPCGVALETGASSLPIQALYLVGRLAPLLRRRLWEGEKLQRDIP